jgi:hypothetical protein
MMLIFYIVTFLKVSLISIGCTQGDMNSLSVLRNQAGEA